MPAFAWRHALHFSALFVLLCVAAPAFAWVTSSVESSVVTIDVERSGRARVAHEFVLRVRGSPLKTFALRGVDADAVLLTDSTATPIRKDQGAKVEPIPLLGQVRPDSSLTLEPDQARGLKAGRYLIRFSYTSDFLGRKLIQKEAGIAEVAWIGPRFEDGIGSARVVFRLPKGAAEPSVVEIDEQQAALGLVEDPGGVFVASLRRGDDKDELELVRPHVAKGEPAVWRVRTGPRAFEMPGLTHADVSGAAAALGREDTGGAAPVAPLLVSLLVAVMYALALALKWRWASQASALRHAVPRALIPLRPVLRILLAGSLLGGAVLVAMRNGAPAFAGSLLVASMLLATQGSPRLLPRLRGPGTWVALREGDVAASDPRPLPGRWLDAGTAPGFVVFACALGALAYVALELLAKSPYQAALVALGSLCLLPLFFSGRLAELPPDFVRAPLGLLTFLVRELARQPAVTAVFWGRMPENGRAPDEIRLLVKPEHALDGFQGIEVGLEYQQGVADFVATPYVMVRVREESASYFALPHGVVWTRGRKPEERVAVVRPKLPTRQLCLALVRRIVEFVALPQAQEPSAFSSGDSAGARRAVGSSIKLPSSRGSGSRSVNPGTTRVPAHAT